MKHYFICHYTINSLTYKAYKVCWADWVSIFIVFGCESIVNVWVIKAFYDCFHVKICGPWNALLQSFSYWALCSGDTLKFLEGYYFNGSHFRTHICIGAALRLSNRIRPFNMGYKNIMVTLFSFLLYFKNIKMFIL